MIEQDIKDALQRECLAVLDSAGLTIDPISPLATNAVEKIEKSTADGFLVTAVQPREYDTPTVPTCRIAATVTFLVRAEKTEVDFGGAVSKLLTLFDGWQACMEDVHTLFSSPSFEVAGFRLGGGDISLDRSARTYTYSHTLEFIGVVTR